jgi:hypothetical protein
MYLLSVLTVALLLSIFQCVSSNSGSSPENRAPCDSLRVGYFDITSPQSGQSLRMGAQDSIIWTNLKSPVDSLVSLYLCKGGKTVQIIAAVLKNKGTLTWKVPYLGTGEDYRIKICAFSDTARANVSCPFNLYSDCLGSFTIMRPESATVCTTHAAMQIQWKSAGILKDSVSLELCIDSIPQSVITSQTGNTGNYVWSIPDSSIPRDNYCIKISCYFDHAISSLSAPFKILRAVDSPDTIQNCAPDSFEPDSKREIASLLTPNGNAQMHTMGNNDTDWIHILADSGKSYHLLVTAMVQPAIGLYHGKDTSAYSDSCHWSAMGPNAFSLKWTCPKNGQWYARIVATGSSGSGCWSYSFQATGQDSPSVSTVISPGLDAIWAAGSTQQIKWIPDSAFLGTEVNVYVYKGSQSVAGYGLVDNSGVLSVKIPDYFLTGNDYRIRIMNHSHPDSSRYSAFFTINGIVTDAYEPDNERDKASLLSPLGTVQNHGLVKEDIDWVKFSLDSGTKYVITSPGSSSLWIRFYYGNDPNETDRFTSTSTKSSFIWTCSKSGVWYARIEPYSTIVNTITYTFTVTVFDSLNMVSFLSPTATTVWTAGSIGTIQWTCVGGPLESGMDVYLCKGEKEIQCLRSLRYSTDISFDWSIPEGLSSGADYRIKIVSSNQQGSYDSPKFTITNNSGIGPDSYEPDDTASQAALIIVDNPAQNRSLTTYDMDWVRFIAEKDSTYFIEARSVSATLPNIYVNLCNGPDWEMPIASDYSDPEKTGMVWMCPRSGSYYLAIFSDIPNYGYFANYGGYGNYSLSIKRYALSTNCKFINPTEQSVWASGSTYPIQWVVDTATFSSYINLQLYQDTAYVMDINSSNNTGVCSFSLPSGMLTSDKYTIRLVSGVSSSIFKSSPAFTISGLIADAYEPDDMFETAHTIAATGAPENHTLTYNDVDNFQFIANPNYLYVIKTTGASSAVSTQIFLLDPINESSGVPVFSTTSDSSATLPMFCVSGGAYIFSVSTTTPGAYQAMVFAYDSTKYALNLTAPQTGEILAVGQSDTIRWSGQVSVGGNVDIYLYKSGNVYLTIAATAANNGSFIWTIPTGIAAGNDYSIKIISQTSPRINCASGAISIKAN